MQMFVRMLNSQDCVICRGLLESIQLFVHENLSIHLIPNTHDVYIPPLCVPWALRSAAVLLSC